MRGTMLWFNEHKDLGYITTDDGERVAVTGSGFESGAGPIERCAGEIVEFTVVEKDGEPHATRVIFVAASEQRRARRRRGGSSF